jgi:hypothetical protein
LPSLSTAPERCSQIKDMMRTPFERSFSCMAHVP